MPKDKIKIELTKDEALVLFEFLSRFSESENLDIQHQSEERVLWNLTCSLEKILVEPFKENYDEILNLARERLKDKE
jgi:hypothetical protein